MRWFIYVATDGIDWWVSEMRTYDANADVSDWVTFEGERFRTHRSGRPFAATSASRRRERTGSPA